MRLLGSVVVLGVTVFVSACNRSPQKAAPADTATAATRASAQAPAPGPIDVCSVISPDVAASVLGPLPSQPPSKTDNAGFGVRDCLYIGPKVSGEGAQTVFTRLMVQAGVGSEAGDMIQADADKRHATIDLPGIGDTAKRSADGTFVWARRGDVSCSAQLDNGLTAGLTPDTAATKLGDLCRKVLAR